MKQKKGLIISALAIVLTLSSIVLLSAFKKEENFKLELNGLQYEKVEVFSEYNEEGYTVYLNDEVVEDVEVLVKNDNLDLDTLGLYYIDYSIANSPDVVTTRMISVVDRIAPTLELIEADLEINVNEEFEDPGVIALDNYDGDISEKVEVSGEVDVTTAGEYTLTYEVYDESYNYSKVERKVTVVESESESQSAPVDKVGNRNPGKPAEKPSTIPPKTGLGDKNNDDSENIGQIPDKTPENSKNEMVKMSFTRNGITLLGVNDSPIDQVGFMDTSGNITSTFNTKVSGKQYSGSLNLTSVPNGTYTLVAPKLGNMKILDKNTIQNRLSKAKVGNRFVTVTYPNDNIVVRIENNRYKYDIAINVGHGGSDPGAIGNGYIEKELNLMVSKYEKARYEEFGLNVYLNRHSNDSYGDVAGDSSLKRLTRSAISFGEIASQSRVAYSNHHNSSTNKNSSGYEIIVAASANRNQLAIQHRVSSLWNNAHKSLGVGGKMYTRDYWSERIYSKGSGQVYDFKNYYAIIREPFERNNQFVTLYEMAFLSNKSNMDWYMAKENWISVAEAKIQANVEALGLTYRPPGFVEPEEKITYGPNRNVDTPITFKTIIIEDPTKEVGTEGINVKGVNGISRKVVRDVFKNGIKVDEEIVEDSFTHQVAVDEVKWVGTKVVEVPPIEETPPTDEVPPVDETP